MTHFFVVRRYSAGLTLVFFLCLLVPPPYSEVFTGPEKRRKRGSLFSRKKKDKSKTKGQSTNCDCELTRKTVFELGFMNFLIRLTTFFSFFSSTACGASINLASYKDHLVECKVKLAKVNLSASVNN